MTRSAPSKRYRKGAPPVGILIADNGLSDGARL